MKKYYKLETGDINLQDLLSSRTYTNPYGFNQCIYCDKDVESSDWRIFKIKDQSQWVTPTRCDCEGAKKELDYKLNLVEGLSELDNLIDEKELNKKIFKNITLENQNDFEEFEEED